MRQKLTRSDSTAAPDGKDGLVVLIPVGHLLPTPKGEAMKTTSSETSQDWPALVEQARKQVIETMETRLGITGLRERILWEEVNTPLTCKLASLKTPRAVG
jgi:phytoene desaturase (3,4-didehydrolycopene-forming)